MIDAGAPGEGHLALDPPFRQFLVTGRGPTALHRAPSKGIGLNLTYGRCMLRGRLDQHSPPIVWPRGETSRPSVHTADCLPLPMGSNETEVGTEPLPITRRRA